MSIESTRSGSVSSLRHKLFKVWRPAVGLALFRCTGNCRSRSEDQSLIELEGHWKIASMDPVSSTYEIESVWIPLHQVADLNFIPQPVQVHWGSTTTTTTTTNIVWKAHPYLEISPFVSSNLSLQPIRYQSTVSTESDTLSQESAVSPWSNTPTTTTATHDYFLTGNTILLKRVPSTNDLVVIPPTEWYDLQPSHEHLYLVFQMVRPDRINWVSFSRLYQHNPHLRPWTHSIHLFLNVYALIESGLSHTFRTGREWYDMERTASYGHTLSHDVWGWDHPLGKEIGEYYFGNVRISAMEYKARMSHARTVGYTSTATEEGKRESNEDTMVDETDQVSGWRIRAVCDGHDGKIIVNAISGAYSAQGLPKLSDFFFKVIRHFSLGRTDTDSEWRILFRVAMIEYDRLMYQILKTDRGGSTCTMTLLSPSKRMLWCVNLGDSRTVLLRFPQSSVFETIDHKPHLEKEKKRIEENGGRVVQIDQVWRVDGKLSLSRALGDFALKRSVDLDKYDPVRGRVCAWPDVTGVPLERHYDYYVFMACDGLWDVMDANHVLLLFKDNPELDTKDIVHRCIYSMGSQDNVSVLYYEIPRDEKFSPSASYARAHAHTPAPTPAPIPSQWSVFDQDIYNLDKTTRVEVPSLLDILNFSVHIAASSSSSFTSSSSSSSSSSASSIRLPMSSSNIKNVYDYVREIKGRTHTNDRLSYASQIPLDHLFRLANDDVSIDKQCGYLSKEDLLDRARKREQLMESLLKQNGGPFTTYNFNLDTEMTAKALEEIVRKADNLFLGGVLPALQKARNYVIKYMIVDEKKEDWAAVAEEQDNRACVVIKLNLNAFRNVDYNKENHDEVFDNGIRTRHLLEHVVITVIHEIIHCCFYVRTSYDVAHDMPFRCVNRYVFGLSGKHPYYWILSKDELKRVQCKHCSTTS